jgi:hypothetical protein
MSLILNETTLFYYNISTSKISKTKLGVIEDWVAKVRPHICIIPSISLTLQVHREKPKGPRHGLAATIYTDTSKTAVSTASRITSKSNAVLVPAKHSAPKKHVKVEPLDNDTEFYGFLEGEDDTEEREVALSSPIKGNQRLSSTVSYEIDP